VVMVFISHFIKLHQLTPKLLVRDIFEYSDIRGLFSEIREVYSHSNALGLRLWQR
jgi:hypothetical protein